MWKITVQIVQILHNVNTQEHNGIIGLTYFEFNDS